jgi:uncharacterized protein with GYD domain
VAKYLVIANYNAEGAKGIVAKGGTARVQAVTKAVEALGGSVESFYFAFGEDDVYTIVDLPDNVAAASLGLTVGASGVVAVRTVVLLTPEEVDRAVKVKVDYRPPGS